MTNKCTVENGCLASYPKIYIQHVKSGKSVAFLAYLTKFSDRYEAKWNEESVYGRMDPIATYQRTQRVIDLGWQVISASEAEARSNMKMISDLVNFHYPSYMAAGNSNLIQSPPLLRIRFDPLVRKGKSGALLGYTKGVDVSPNVDAGFIFNNFAANQDMMPKELEINLSFTVLHEHDLGFRGRQRQEETKHFPYGDFNGPCVDNSNPYMTSEKSKQDAIAQGEEEGDKGVDTATRLAALAKAMGGDGEALPNEADSQEFNDRLNLLPSEFAPAGDEVPRVDLGQLRQQGAGISDITKRRKAAAKKAAAERRQEKRRERADAARRARAERRRQIEFKKWDRKETRKREKEGEEIIERAKALEKFSRGNKKLKQD